MPNENNDKPTNFKQAIEDYCHKEEDVFVGNIPCGLIKQMLQNRIRELEDNILHAFYNGSELVFLNYKEQKLIRAKIEECERLLESLK